ncbi:GTP-binding protein Obg [Clostridiaceae bacterium JG1575]|nr:GTP-binding protein Obg [Clostridiaceae bacterium JG1575]
MNQFIDYTSVYLKSGSGGNGSVSFRREKYIPLGGPDGGDGGKGGSIVLLADENMTTLLDLKYKRRYVAPSGMAGSGAKCYGKDGQDIIIRVPVGTVVKEKTSGKIIADMKENGHRVVVLRGGKGGKGNAKFATPTRQAPDFAEPGMPGDEMEVVLELKVLADVGLVGFPNVGKSTILSMVSQAQPKIADYHFTTLSPNLGVVNLKGIEPFILADIPGIIEGASEGVGLGIQFLRHIERTRILIHVVDIAGSEGRSPEEDFDRINNELLQYSKALAQRPQIVVANKADLMEADEAYERFKAYVEAKGYHRVHLVSAGANIGLRDLMKDAAELLSKTPTPPDLYGPEDFYVPDEKHFTYEIHRNDAGVFVVSGSFVERLLDATNIQNPDHLRYFHKVLRNKGVMDELIAKGIKDGDTVRMRDFEFEFMR